MHPLFILFMLFIFSSSALTQRVQAESLSFGYAGEFCPAICNEVESGKRGYVLDLLNAIGKTQGFDVKWVNLPMKRLRRSLQKGDIDFVMRPANALRQNKMAQSRRPLAVFQIAVLKRKQYKFKLNGVSSFENSIWGVVAGQKWPAAFQKYIDKHRNSEKIVLIYEESAYRRLAKLVNVGRVDVVLGGGAMLNEIQRTSENPDNLVVEPTSFFGPIPLYAGFSLQNEQSKSLAKRIDSGLKKLRATGQMSEILDAYGIPLWTEQYELK